MLCSFMKKRSSLWYSMSNKSLPLFLLELLLNANGQVYFPIENYLKVVLEITFQGMNNLGGNSSFISASLVH